MNSDPMPNVNMIAFIRKRLNIGHKSAFATATAMTMMNALYHGPTVKSVLI